MEGRATFTLLVSNAARNDPRVTTSSDATHPPPGRFAWCPAPARPALAARLVLGAAFCTVATSVIAYPWGSPN
ncbi:hypothetical protein GCM10023320_00370 [Pseudonocardia adelaidensis]|uniref:Uncharacterized protein n=1 Tax=Pseudonocardia adelaidensis TaxID=648754 RepID=A0ABP9N5A2_9PSEU